MTYKEKIEEFIHYNTAILYLDKKNIDHQLYIDCSDVITMLLGLKSIISHNKDLNRSAYESETTIVYSLLYGGWLNKASLMLPHQEELSNKLQQDFLFTTAEDDDIDEFWTYVEQSIGLKQQDMLDSVPLENIINRLKPKSHELYKANYLLRETSWKRRLSYMVKQPVIEFEETDASIFELVKTPIFKTIYERFAFKRPSRHSKNNFSDSLSLCIIHKKLQEFHAAPTIKELPLFFSDNNTFSHVIHDVGLTAEFTCQIDHISFPVICDGTFLKYMALFNNKIKIREFLNKEDKNTFQDYEELCSKIFNPQKRESTLADDYKNLIEKFIHSRFMQVCWINNDKEQVHGLIANLMHSNGRSIQSKEGKETIKEDVDDLIEKLKMKVNKYSIFRDAFQEILQAQEKRAKLLTSNLNKYRDRQPYPFDIIIDYSLTRFSIEPIICNDVRRLASQLLFIDNKEQNHALVITIADYLIAGIEKTDTRKLMTAMLILWILEDYKLMIRIFKTFDGRYTHYSQAFLHAAALIKTSTHKGQRRKTIQILEDIQDSALQFNFKSNYKTAIAASYICFSLWVRFSEQNFFRKRQEPDYTREDDMSVRLFEEALVNADNAISWLEHNQRYTEDGKTHRTAKYYYIINNYIYYITMGGDNQAFAKLNREVNILENAELHHKRYWQNRFYDTLAVYHFRKACIALESNKVNRFEHHKKLAQQRIDQALEEVISTEDQQQYEYLRNKIVELSFE